jgi:hypothetical protein
MDLSNHQSAISNQQSAIKTQQSTINNQQSQKSSVAPTRNVRGGRMSVTRPKLGPDT